MSDWYHSPEVFDMRPVGEIEWRDESYEFDVTAVWQHEPTLLFVVASDSGCSCPSPFETFLEAPVVGRMYDTASSVGWQLTQAWESSGSRISKVAEISSLVRACRALERVSDREVQEVFGVGPVSDEEVRALFGLE